MVKKKSVKSVKKAVGVPLGVKIVSLLFFVYAALMIYSIRLILSISNVWDTVYIVEFIVAVFVGIGLLVWGNWIRIVSIVLLFLVGTISLIALGFSGIFSFPFVIAIVAIGVGLYLLLNKKVKESFR